MLKGRLGLETARVPHVDRHGLLWLGRGKLTVQNGNLVFSTAGTDALARGVYDLPFQTISNILLGPGCLVSHDALRLLARHQTGLLAVGTNGVRVYATSMPPGPDHSRLAREHARVWADPEARIQITRRMYAMRLGEYLPHRDLNALRGVEGHRMKQVYKNLAEQFGVKWSGRSFDRNNPENDNDINTAINHAATAMYASARIAVALTGTIPQLGFIHEASGHAFALDIADLFRANTTLPIAFGAVKQFQRREGDKLERITRTRAGRTLQQKKVIAKMIDAIKELIEESESPEG
ncbi:type I-E CRISPR-associated endonuclease Cas1e [Bradymonas sediminis]|uniref:CRISPR-associated endonuclease Cas1 n=1 Tax=Bradymonas sediminis TaxID=1548548 RepID=A0A2Z4FH11_9DELT|nr:type I-E CRISPR-associated endonuclease Cas1e [Bradymonas sediminis]AWV88253.1 type I-E CRISPR-associated endonuclease Cas1 [Bradymonas sediminis]TDP77377.1 CRISPR-associated Cas1 family protein [Bradymonas sediminis]